MEPCRALRAHELEPPSLVLTDVVRVHVDRDGEAALTGEEDDRGVLDGVGTLRTLDRRAHALHPWKVEQPPREVEQRQSELEERAAPRLGATEPPRSLLHTTTVGASAHRPHLAELAAADERIECLRVEAEAVVVRDHHDLLGFLRRREDPLDRSRVESERTLAHHVLLGPERGEDMHLVQMVGRRDDHRVEVGELEQFLDVGADIAHAEPLRERPGLGTVVVAECGDLHAAHLGEDRKVGGLGDRAESEDADLYRTAGRAMGRGRCHVRLLRGEQPSGDRADGGARVVGPQDRASVLTGPGATDRAPLTHTHAMTVTVTTDHRADHST